MNELIEKLTAPLRTKWKVQAVSKPNQKGKRWAVCVAYNDARDVFDRLDEVFGLNWATDFKTVGDQRFGGIGVKIGQEWVWRWDNGTEPGRKMDEEKRDEGMQKKGETSDSVKRAGYQWGIGRYLYSLPKVNLPADDRGNIYSYDEQRLFGGDDVTNYIEKVVLNAWEKSGQEIPTKIYFLPKGGTAQGQNAPQQKPQAPQKAAKKVFDADAFSKRSAGIQEHLDGGATAETILTELTASGYEVPKAVENLIRKMKPNFGQQHFDDFRPGLLAALKKGKTIDEVIDNLKKGTHLSEEWEMKIRALKKDAA